LAGGVSWKVMDVAAYRRLVSNVVRRPRNGVAEPVLKRALEYWHNIDKDIGDRSAAGVNDR
jgi:catalase